MAKQDLYALLGVDQDATSAALEAAYQSTSATLLERADAHSSDVQNRLKFLRFARETLLHEGRRAAYDASLRKPATPAPAPLRASRAAVPRPLLFAAIATLGVAAATMWFLRSSLAQMPPPAAAPAAPTLQMDADAPASAAATQLSAEELFERYAQSVVVIEGLNGESKQILQGSGVVVADQKVITNCHVAKSAAAVVVKLADKRYPAILLRVDADPQHDLCLLAVDGLHAPAIPLAAIASVKVGKRVFALGAPKGLELTLSEGIVSSLRKYDDSHFIQTTASISPGSSGGGLFNDAGELIGITTFHFAGGQNLNFAVPVDWVGKLLQAKESLAVLGSDAINDLLGKWRCKGTKESEAVTYRFSSDGSFAMTHPDSPKQAAPAGSYAIMGNHTLVLKSSNAEPPEVYVQIIALNSTDLHISSPFFQDAQTYRCRKSDY